MEFTFLIKAYGVCAEESVCLTIANAANFYRIVVIIFVIFADLQDGDTFDARGSSSKQSPCLGIGDAFHDVFTNCSCDRAIAWLAST